MHGYHKNFFETNFLSFKMFGIWVPNNLSVVQRSLYDVYIVTLLAIAGLYFISEIIVIKDTRKNLFDLLSNIGMLVTHVVGVSKFATMFLKREKIEEMMEKLQCDRFKYESVGDFKPCEIFNASKEVSSKHTWCLICVYGFVGISAHFSALISMRQASSQDYINCNDYVPYYGYVPFTLDTIGKCHFLFFFMDVPLVIFALHIAGKNNFIGTIFVFHLKHFQHLILCLELFQIALNANFWLSPKLSLLSEYVFWQS